MHIYAIMLHPKKEKNVVKDERSFCERAYLTEIEALRSQQKVNTDSFTSSIEIICIDTDSLINFLSRIKNGRLTE